MRITRTGAAASLLLVESGIASLGGLFSSGLTAEYGDITDTALRLSPGIAAVALVPVGLVALVEAGWRLVEDDEHRLRAERDGMAFEVVTCDSGTSCIGGSLDRVRTFVVAAVTVVVVSLAGGCAGSGDPDGSDDRQGNGSFGDPTPQDPQTSAPQSPRADEDAVIESEACQEVRTGIEAFNLGEFDETVEHFEQALPLAEEQDDGSVLASQLIEAVRYYAELDAELYPEAARSSPEFAKYKAITLGQCALGADETPESPSVEI